MDVQKPFFPSSSPPPPLASHMTTSSDISSSSSSETLNGFFSSFSQPPDRFSPASWLSACISRSLSSPSFSSSTIKDSSLSHTERTSAASVDSSFSSLRDGEDREKGEEEEEERKLSRREGEKLSENELLADRLEKVLLRLQKEVQQQISVRQIPKKELSFSRLLSFFLSRAFFLSFSPPPCCLFLLFYYSLFLFASACVSRT